MRKLATSSIVTLLIVFSLLMMIGCQQKSESIPAPIPVAPAPSTPVSALPPAEKGNPKLDSQLNQLVQAEMRGEDASFAEQNNIALVDGRIRVIVECSAGQVDAADEAVSAIGVVETSYDNLLQVTVPLNFYGGLLTRLGAHLGKAIKVDGNETTAH